MKFAIRALPLMRLIAGLSSDGGSGRDGRSAAACACTRLARETRRLLRRLHRYTLAARLRSHIRPLQPRGSRSRARRCRRRHDRPRGSRPEDRVVATILGAAVGALVGAKIGSELDERDQRCIGQSLELAQPRQAVQWRNQRQESHSSSRLPRRSKSTAAPAACSSSGRAPTANRRP